MPGISSPEALDLMSAQGARSKRKTRLRLRTTNLLQPPPGMPRMRPPCRRWWISTRTRGRRSSSPRKTIRRSPLRTCPHLRQVPLPRSKRSCMSSLLPLLRFRQIWTPSGLSRSSPGRAPCAAVSPSSWTAPLPRTARTRARSASASSGAPTSRCSRAAPRSPPSWTFQRTGWTWRKGLLRVG